jgi:hypothetical protein
MDRVMFQADRALLERVRRAARDRRVSVSEFVRNALEHELATSADGPPPLTSVGAIRTGGQARKREYAPEPWR